MKFYLILFALFITAFAKAQVKDPYALGYYNGDPTGEEVSQPSGTNTINYYDINYTASTSSGEWTHTNQDGTTIDVTWSIAGTTLSWESTVTAGTGVDLHLHSLYIADEYSEDPQTYTYDDFEDGDYAGFGSNYWHSSGSADLGNIQRNIRFIFENDEADATYTDTYDIINVSLMYRQPQ